ncbi:MAG: hypothetical protein QOE41_1751 [Mycobacterium sp.]|jgi:hypothetical protein|nr:hypothetical protein [Mycobacterium sp.]MDT5276495.1 hypothetical protein [Mycobacterium sp.]
MAFLRHVWEAHADEDERDMIPVPASVKISDPDLVEPGDQMAEFRALDDVTTTTGQRQLGPGDGCMRYFDFCEKCSK